MKRFKKMVVSGALSAAMIIAGSSQMAVALSAGASTLAPVPGSAFRYEVITKELSRSGNTARLKVTIRFLNNPGIDAVSMTVKAGSGCVITGVDDVPSGWTTMDNAGHAHFAYMNGDPNYSSTKKYELNTYATASVGNSNSFSVELEGYVSDPEGITEIPNFNEDANITVPVTSSSQMVLGDTNSNNVIEQVDAYNTMCAVNNYSGKLSVNYLRTVKNLGTWQNLLPQLKFAEAMDVNFDGYITKEDYTAILQYDSYESLGEPLTNSPIGKVYYVNL